MSLLFDMSMNIVLSSTLTGTAFSIKNPKGSLQLLTYKHRNRCCKDSTFPARWLYVHIVQNGTLWFFSYCLCFISPRLELAPCRLVTYMALNYIENTSVKKHHTILTITYLTNMIYVYKILEFIRKDDT